MSETTIEWTTTTGPDGAVHAGYSFNAWVGCQKISPACDHCYAESWAKRAGHPELWHGERRRTTEANWKQPLKWEAKAAKLGVRLKVFCCSLADVFDNEADPKWRADLFRLIRETPHLDWLLLSKRIGNATRMIEAAMIDGHLLTSGSPQWPWPNVWLGSTIANQEEADRDIPKLLATPARVRFLSCEPLLGPIDLRGLWHRCPTHDFAGGFCIQDCGDWQRLSWIISGGESGPKARPSHPGWFRSLRDQCTAAGVPFHFKQWGEYGFKADLRPEVMDEFGLPPADRPAWMQRMGKKSAGRTLDGVVHDQYPKVEQR